MLKINRQPPVQQPIEEIELTQGSPLNHVLRIWTVGQNLIYKSQPNYVRFAEFQDDSRNRSVYDMTPSEVDEFTKALREMAGLDRVR